jgi:hypothetical protein
LHRLGVVAGRRPGGHAGKLSDGHRVDRGSSRMPSTARDEGFEASDRKPACPARGEIIPEPD